MKSARREIDRRNLLRELANNKVDALEIVREALANAKDHGASRIWIRTNRGLPPEQPINIFIFNNGDGMDHAQLEAFWGISTSVKPAGQAAVGYKGHGTKLFFACKRLSVSTRVESEKDWRLTSLESPSESDVDEVPIVEMSSTHKIAGELKNIGQLEAHGVAILIEGCMFRDASERLLSRRTIESYCDWFTVIGDVRSGLFETRAEWHRVVNEHEDLSSLRDYEVPIRSLRVDLCVNGEKVYSPICYRADYMMVS